MDANVVVYAYVDFTYADYVDSAGERLVDRVATTTTTARFLEHD
jgi:hypothetical protein